MRTTVDLDDELVARVMNLYGLPTKRAAIPFALESLVGPRGYRPRDMLDLRGMAGQATWMRCAVAGIPPGDPRS